MDITLLIDEYLSDKRHLVTDDDSLNVYNGSIIRWDFANIPCPSMEELKALQPQVESGLQQEQTNAESLAFLASTDFKVLRHIRQKALGQELSLSEEEYLALEQQRSDAAARIIR